MEGGATTPATPSITARTEHAARRNYGTSTDARRRDEKAALIRTQHNAELYIMLTGLNVKTSFCLRDGFRTNAASVIHLYVAFVPGLGLTYLTLLIAIYGIVAGFSLIAAAARLRSLAS